MNETQVICPGNGTEIPEYNGWSTSYELAGMLYCICFIGYIAVSIAFMFKRKSHFPIRRARKPGLVLMSAIGILMHLVVGPAREVYGRDAFSCDLLLVLGGLFLPLTASPTLVRLILYRQRVAVERRKRDIAKQLHYQQGKFNHSEPLLLPSLENQRVNRKVSAEDSDSIGTISTDLPELEGEGDIEGGKRKLSGLRRGSGMLTHSLQALLSALQTKAFLTGTPFSSIVVTLVSAPFVAVAFSLFRQAPFNSGCTGCAFLEPSLVFGCIAFFSVVSIFSLWTVRDVSDAVGLKYEMVTVFVTLLLGGSCWFALDFTDPLGLQATGRLSYSFLLSVTLGVVHFVQCVVPVLASYRSAAPGHLCCHAPEPVPLRLSTWDRPRQVPSPAGARYRVRAGTGNSYGLHVPGELALDDLPPSPRSFPAKADTPDGFRLSASRRVRGRGWTGLFLASSGGRPWRDSGELSLGSSAPPSREPSWRNRAVVDAWEQEASADLSVQWASMRRTSAFQALGGEKPARMGTQDLRAVLQDDGMREKFMQHLYRELSSESLLFWEEVRFMKEKWADVDLELPEAQRRFRRGAKALYNTFIKTHSVLQVNIGYECRKDLDNRFQDKNTTLGVNLFDDAIREIENLLEADSFPRFVALIQKTTTG